MPRNIVISAILCLIVQASAGSAASIKMDFGEPFTQKFSGRGSFDKKYACTRCQTPPKVDGILDDEVWQASGEIEFGDGRPRTVVRACYDDAMLYFAFVCHELLGRKATGMPRDRDADVWKDDAIEICIGPPQVRKTRISYHIIVSVANSLYDKRTRFGKSFGDEWNPTIEYTVHRQDDRWTVEVAIAARELDMPGWPSVMGANVGRDGPGLGPSFWGKRRDVESSAFAFQGTGDTEAEQGGDDGFVSNQTVAGNSLGIYADRTYARPGERWIEIDCKVSPTRVSLENTRIDVKLFGLAQTTPVETFSTVPQRERGRLDVDLRSYGLDTAEVSVELFEGEERTGASKFILTARPCKTPLKPGDRITMIMDVPEGVQPSRHPVTLGVPFPAGALWDADRVRVVNRAGELLPHQKEVTGLWAPDGSIKWMRFDTLVTSQDGCFVEFGQPSGNVAPSTPLKVIERGDRVIVDTGPARYVLAKGTSPVQEVWLDGKRVASSASTRGLYVVDQTGRYAQASAEEEDMKVEARGPVASCVRFEGWYTTPDGERLARHITRVECIAGHAAAKVTHTFVLTQDTNEVWFKEIGWELAVTPSDSARALFGVDQHEHEKQLAVPLTTKGSGVVFWHVAVGRVVVWVWVFRSLQKEIQASHPPLHLVVVGDGAVTNPLYHVVATALPFYGGIPPVWQQAGLFTILAGPAVAALVATLPRGRARQVAALVIVLAALAERVLVLPVPLPLDAAPAHISEAYDRADGEGGLVDVPRLFAGTRVARGFTFLAQSRHKHPIPVAINLGIARYDAYRPVNDGWADAWGQAAACLREGKIRWLMVHPGWYRGKDDGGHVIAKLTKLVGAPVHRGRDEVLFDLSRLPREISAGGQCPRTSGRRARKLGGKE